MPRATENWVRLNPVWVAWLASARSFNLAAIERTCCFKSSTLTSSFSTARDTDCPRSSKRGPRVGTFSTSWHQRGAAVDRSGLAFPPLTSRRGDGGPHPFRREWHIDVAE